MDKRNNVISIKICRRCWKRNGVNKVDNDLIEEEKQCKLCNGVFLRLEKIAEEIINELNSIPDIKTFSIGTSIPKSSEALEEIIYDFIDINKAKSIKPDLNTELGKIIEKKTKYKFNPDPDVRIIYNIKAGSITKNITSLYIYGRYNKLKRGIRQTKKEDSKEESVEGLIEEILLKEIGGKGSRVILHGSGREDIDVLMLGNGRPFIIEITKPNKRNLTKDDLAELSRKINKKQNGKISVKFERTTSKEFVEVIKRAKFDKEYEAIVSLDNPIKNEEIQKLPNSMLLMQRTPKRVLIRRADRVRKRRIKNLKAEYIDERTIKLHILSQSGTYIKEFISGDDGRTVPSISSILKNNAKCRELNVVSIHTEWLDNFW